jgi:hydrogenase nickel incorporation protein HypB
MIIENVGNLVCPAAFDLGTDINVLIASVVQKGMDNPYKYRRFTAALMC